MTEQEEDLIFRMYRLVGDRHVTFFFFCLYIDLVPNRKLKFLT